MGGGGFQRTVVSIAACLWRTVVWTAACLWFLFISSGKKDGNVVTRTTHRLTHPAVFRSMLWLAASQTYPSSRIHPIIRTMYAGFR